MSAEKQCLSQKQLLVSSFHIEYSTTVDIHKIKLDSHFYLSVYSQAKDDKVWQYHTECYSLHSYFEVLLVLTKLSTYL